MKCPHCGYEDALQGNEEGFLQGERGDFFEVGKAEREHPEHETLKDTAKVYGCPDCMKLFMGHMHCY